MNFKLIIKGFIVGLGKIIPGVSGSMLAMTLGIYEQVIEAITNFFSNIKENSKLLVNFGFGVFLAIIFFSKLILFCLNNYYFETMYLFLGLILGTIIPFTKNLKINLKTIIIFFLTLSIMLFFTSNNSLSNFYFNGSLIHYFYLIFLGMIDALTSIVPGISGTAIFMLLGSYELVLNILGNPINIMFLIYSLGMIFGIIFTSYLMNYLLKNKREETYSLIFAFMISSILILLLKLIKCFKIYYLIILLVGFIFGYLFDK